MKPLKRFGPLVLLVLLLALPLVINDPSNLSIAFVALTFAAAAMGWNIFSGYTGYLTLGYGTFYGFGAYTLVLLCKYWHVPAGYAPLFLLPLTGLVAALFALPIGWISLRTRRETFMVLTVATLFIFQLLAFNLSGFTSGSSGVDYPVIHDWDAYFFNIPFYYTALILLVLATAVAWWIRSSRYGLGLLAIRDDEDRAQGLGISTGAYKLVAFCVSSFFAGTIGALVTYYNGMVNPEGAFTPVFGLTPALLVFFGGIGTLSGPLFGAFLLVPLQQWLLQSFGASGYDIILYGILLLLILVFLPEGVIPGLTRLWRKQQAQRKDTAQKEVPPDAETSLLVESIAKSERGQG